MITRIFRARVHPELKSDFKRDFAGFAMPMVKSHKGLLSVSISESIVEPDNEFMMISVWQDVESIKAMAGDDWREAYIPDRMAKYFVEYSLEHFENFGE